MYLKENILLAINGLRANKMRALLTMLGIIIGISSVISIVTIGLAMTSATAAEFGKMGANNVSFYLQGKEDEYGNIDRLRKNEPSDLITDEMIQQYIEVFRDQVAAYEVAVPVGLGQAVDGRNTVSADVVGTNAEAVDVKNIEIMAGHFLSQKEVGAGKNVAVVADALIRKIYPGMSPQDALGKEVKIRLTKGISTFSVVGIYRFVPNAAAGQTGDSGTAVYIPVSAAQRITNGSKGYESVAIKTNSGLADAKKFSERSIEYFNTRFYRANKYVRVGSFSMESAIAGMLDTIKKMSMAIGVIAGISLLVGGIGVMNIMLVSVTERTREIGTRKALGAKNSAIRVQFIVEAIIICSIGGAIGIILGSAAGYGGSIIMGFPSWPTISSIVLAVGFSMAIGIFFGYYPANKAAKLDPIEALRYE